MIYQKKCPEWLMKFLAEHSDASNMLIAGFSDYIASRACRRANCFFQSAILGEQALEKAYKAGLRLSGNTTPFKKLNHKPSEIAKELKKVAPWFNPLSHEELNDALEYHFGKSRYPPTAEDKDCLECRLGISQEQLDDLDCAILDYYDALPVPDEVKFSLGVYGTIQYRRIQKEHGLPLPEWDALCWMNQRLNRTLDDYEARAEEYFDRLAALRLTGLT
jgi:HEPN domain-containing protein